MTFQVTIVSGNLIHDTQLLGEMTPYVKIISTKQDYITSIAKGSQPWWNYPIQCMDTEKELRVQVFNKQKGDSLVGEGVVRFESVMKEPNTERKQYVDLVSQNAPAGTLLVKLFYETGMKYVGSSLSKTFEANSLVSRNLDNPNSQIRSGVDSKTQSKTQQPHSNQTDSAKDRAFKNLDMVSNTIANSLRKNTGKLELQQVEQPTEKSDLNSPKPTGVHRVITFKKVQDNRRNIFSCMDGPICCQGESEEIQFVPKALRGSGYSNLKKW